MNKKRGPVLATPRRASRLDDIIHKSPVDDQPVTIQGGTQGEQRHERDSLFRLLVESVRDYAIFLLDPSGNIASWNEGARRVKGYEAAEIIGKHFSTFYLPEEVARGKPIRALGIAEAEGSWKEEGWRIRKGGTRFWASVVITALRDETGELVGFAKVTRDLTERKQAEDERMQLLEMERQARRATEKAAERLRALQRVTEVALIHLDLDNLLQALLDRISEVLEVDTVAVLLLEEPERKVLIPRAAKGIEEEVALGIRIPVGQGFAGRVAAEQRAIVLDDVDHADVLNPVLREKGLRSLLGVPLMVAGEVIGILHVGTLYPRGFTEDDTQFLQIVADRVAMAIDHARLIEVAYRARREAEIAEATLRARDEFLSIAAHELKTPLTGLQVGVQMLIRRLHRGVGPDPAELTRVLRTVERQSVRLSRLVSQLVETVRVEAGQLQPQPVRTNLSELVRELVETIQSQSDRHQFVVTAREGIWATVDALRLEEVLINLLDNAVKFSPEGGQITIELAPPEPGRVRLAVQDSGLGIPLRHRPHIFDRFYQAHGDEHRSGMGLGLYICREIIEMHGGRIWAEFPDGGGTRIVLELPSDE